MAFLIDQNKKILWIVLTVYKLGSNKKGLCITYVNLVCSGSPLFPSREFLSLNMPSWKVENARAQRMGKDLAVLLPKMHHCIQTKKQWSAK